MRFWQRLFLLNAMLLIVALSLLTWAQTQIFGQSLLDYVNGLDQARAQTLAQRLLAHYQSAGGWQLLSERPGMFRRLVVGEDRTMSDASQLWDSGPTINEMPNRQRAVANSTDIRRRPPPEGGAWFARLALYDPAGALLAGNPRVLFDRNSEAGNQFAIKPIPIKQLAIKQKSQLLAWLVVQPATQLTEASDQAFVSKKRQAFLTVGALVLLLALLSSWWMARRFTAPISVIQRAMADLGRGKLDSQIPVHGTDELSALALDVNRLAQTLGQHQVARQQWAGDLAHELRTPLAILRSETEALVDGIRPLSISAVAAIANEIQLLNALVDDLHQLSLSDMGALAYRFESVPIVPILESISAQFAVPIANAGLRLHCVSAEALSLRADPIRLRQLLMNLLNNCIRYTDPGGVIEWQLSKQRGLAVLQIDDSAPGVADAELSLLFDRLYRSERARSRDQVGTGQVGTGLGLSIVKAIVSAHGGTLAAQHSPLGGLRIVVQLPLFD